MYRATCNCIDGNVLAFPKSRLYWFWEWGWFTFILTFLMIFLTSGWWVLGVLAYHLDDILNPGFKCNKCGHDISPSQFTIE